MSTVAARPQPRRKYVSLVVPFFNEGEAVQTFHDGLMPVLALLTDYELEIVCVDDGSSDDTLARLLRLAAAHPIYRVIELSRNFGKEAALTAGLDAATGACVVPMDADLQDPPPLLLEMLQRWENGADVVLARRSDRSSDGWLKRQSAATFYRLHNVLADIRIPCNVGDFRLMDRRVVEALKQLPERQRFMKGLFSWVGFRTEIVDYVRPPRSAGQSKFKTWKLWNFALEGLTSFSTAPLRIWTYVGMASATLTAMYALFVFVRTIALGIALPGYASLLIAILFFGSLQLISLGLIGEYLGRMYLESKQRPVYIVRNRFGTESQPKVGVARTIRHAGVRRRHSDSQSPQRARTIS
jgi:polyisoprenyl-phosphate glycosyltransferase